ncbi:hypothetical protein GGP65_002956 [Salinibacter ruber]|nr:hypothetical protein [Salinibacter ruber]
MLAAAEGFLVLFRLIPLLAQLLNRIRNLGGASARYFKPQLLGRAFDVDAALCFFQNELGKRLFFVSAAQKVVQVEVVARAVGRGRKGGAACWTLVSGVSGIFALQLYSPGRAIEDEPGVHDRKLVTHALGPEQPADRVGQSGFSSGIGPVYHIDAVTELHLQPVLDAVESVDAKLLEAENIRGRCRLRRLFRRRHS